MSTEPDPVVVLNIVIKTHDDSKPDPMRFQKAYKKRVQALPEYRARHNEVQAASLDRVREDGTTLRQVYNERKKERYHNDPEFRARMQESRRASYRRQKAASASARDVQ